MVKGHHLQLRSHHQLFHKLKSFNNKAPTSDHPVIQKEMDKLLAKGSIEPLLEALAFTQMFLQLLSILMAYAPYWILGNLITVYIPTFKMPTVRQVWQLIQPGDYAFSFNLKDAYLHIAIVKHCHHFYVLFGKIKFISRRFCHWG